MHNMKARCGMAQAYAKSLGHLLRFALFNLRVSVRKHDKKALSVVIHAQVRGGDLRTP